MLTRILLVDDSESVRHAMRSLLEQNPKLEVCGEAGDGQTAVQAFRRLRPDLVILDFSMPVKNGLETAREISAFAPEVPLVLCTMYASEQVRKQALRAGIKAIVSKSDNLGRQLLRTIKAISPR